MRAIASGLLQLSGAVAADDLVLELDETLAALVGQRPHRDDRERRVHLGGGHRVAGGGPDKGLLELGMGHAFGGADEAGAQLHARRAHFHESHRIAAREDATGSNQGNIQLLGHQPGMDLRDDGGQVVLGPVHAEAQVPTRQRAFDDDVVGQPVGAGALAQEQLQRPQRGHDDAELGVTEARVILDQREGAQMQAGRQRDAVNTRVEGGRQAHAQGFPRRVHGQFLHAVHEDQPGAALGLHGLADVQAGRLGELAQVELHSRLVGVLHVVLVELQLLLDELGIETTVGNRLHHRIRDVTDSAQPRRFESQVCSGDINPHAANHNGHILLLAEAQTEIINSFHETPSRRGVPLGLLLASRWL